MDHRFPSKVKCRLSNQAMDKLKPAVKPISMFLPKLRVLKVTRGPSTKLLHLSITHNKFRLRLNLNNSSMSTTRQVEQQTLSQVKSLRLLPLALVLRYDIDNLVLI